MRRLTYVALALGVLLGFTVSYWPDARATRNSGGTYSLPAGNPVVAGTTISSTVHNATMSDLGAEITNSLDRTGRGCMTGQLQSASGTSAAPGVTFCSETSSGFWREASNDIRFGVGAAENFQALKSYDQFRVSVVFDGGINVTNGYAAGVGVTSRGGAGGAGAAASNGTDSTGASPRVALNVTNGTIQMGMTDPNPDAGFTDTLTTMNFPKAVARIQSGSATPQIQSGFNVTTASCAGNVITLNLANAMAAEASMVVMVSPYTSNTACFGATASTSSITIGCSDLATPTTYNLCSTGIGIGVTVFGPQ